MCINSFCGIHNDTAPGAYAPRAILYKLNYLVILISSGCRYVITLFIIQFARKFENNNCSKVPDKLRLILNVFTMDLNLLISVLALKNKIHSCPQCTHSLSTFLLTKLYTYFLFDNFNVILQFFIGISSSVILLAPWIVV